MILQRHSHSLSLFHPGLVLAIAIAICAAPLLADSHKAINVLVWDERQPVQKETYGGKFLGQTIAEYLKSKPGLNVTSASLDDPGQGLSKLDEAQVVVWWGHVRHPEITVETSRKIVERIKEGELSMVALHSAHWANPFVEAMYERTRIDAKRRFPGANAKIEFIEPERFTVPSYDSIATPAYYALRGRNGTKVRVDLPNCVFPTVRADGKPSTLTTMTPDHPIAAGIPGTFEIPETEMYDEPFHVPDPDVLVFREDFHTGGWFRAGMVWNIGKGKVFYFRPGHETYSIFKQEYPLKIVENAVRWLGGE